MCVAPTNSRVDNLVRDKTNTAVQELSLSSQLTATLSPHNLLRYHRREASWTCRRGAERSPVEVEPASVASELVLERSQQE